MANKIPGARIRMDREGRIRYIDHAEQPYKIRRRLRSPRATSVAVQYIKEVIGIQAVRITSRRDLRDEAIDLYLVSEKTVMNNTVVEFQQQLHGVPVWFSGVSVCLNSKSLDVLNSTISYDYDLKPKVFKEKELESHARSLDRDTLIEMLALRRNLPRVKIIEPEAKLSDFGVRITKISPLLYRYYAERRQEPEERDEERRFLGTIPRLALPKVDAKIREGAHYFVNEVLFTITSRWGEVHWRAFIESETNSVLYLRALVAHITAGLVFDFDPLTRTGDTTITPASPVDVLNAERTPRPLPGLASASPQALVGQYVSLQDLQAPSVAPPTVAVGSDFDFDANTDDFSATNAYYHSDAVFRMVEEMGFDMNTYFDGTNFPVPIDHRGKFGQVNAKAPGTPTGAGSDGFRFGLVQSGQPVGIATALRIVLHEFGHAILWDNVHSPNFGFAHSAGDSLGAVLCDTRSLAPDRFETFPWIMQSNPGIDRRHDRDVTAGWAWGGANDDGGYGSEQILSTSHFRAYLSLGGGSSDLCDREFASRYIAYLIIYGVGMLTPTTNSPNPEDWVATLMNCDRSTINFEGQPGGLVHKVIRWAFEKQGAYQSPGAPTPVVTEGAPPEVDVYINDGRNGEYIYSEDYCQTTEIWNRHEADGGAAHQHPICCVPNYAYVIVRNRGTQPAEGVSVRAYHRGGWGCCACDRYCESVKHMIWPYGFKPMRTSTLGAGPIPPGGYDVVGPFDWIPAEMDCMLMAVDADQDLSNINSMPPSETVPLRRFVPFDNNIGVRGLCRGCRC